MSVILYGIKNCDTIKKAKKWLQENDIQYAFHDFRVEGINKTLLNSWFKQLSWEELLNTRGTTWRKLPEETRENINKTSVVSIMLDQPAIIKRPVLSYKNKYYLGFKEEKYKQIFEQLVTNT